MKKIFGKLATVVLIVALISPFSLWAAQAQNEGHKKEPKLQSKRSQASKETDIKLNCGGSKTLGKLLAKLNPEKGHTIRVSGVCNENVSLVDFQHLILITEDGASITDASGGALPVVDVEYTTSFEMIGFTIDGGAPGVICANNSSCVFANNTIQNAGDDGVYISQSKALFDSDVIQNNASNGIRIISGSAVTANGVSLLNNAANGSVVNYNSTLNANVCTVQGNGSGIRASGSSVLRLQENTITQNGHDGGVALLVSLAYFAGGNTVTDNGNAGVRVKDLSMGVFLGEDVTGNQGGTDVLCEPQAPQTRGTADSINGGTTNCVETGTPG